MSTTIDRDRLVPPLLNDRETEMVRIAERMIMACLDHSRAATITIESDDGSSPSVQVPPQVLRVLGQTLGLMARHQPIMLVPEKQELSTVEAANFLNFSRPFLIQEIEAGRLVHRVVVSRTSNAVFRLDGLCENHAFKTARGARQADCKCTRNRS